MNNNKYHYTAITKLALLAKFLSNRDVDRYFLIACEIFKQINYLKSMKYFVKIMITSI